jgi:hypothetical protein
MESAFYRILHCAALSQILKVGDIAVAIDGTNNFGFLGKLNRMNPRHGLSIPT